MSKIHEQCNIFIYVFAENFGKSTVQESLSTRKENDRSLLEILKVSNGYKTTPL